MDSGGDFDGFFFGSDKPGGRRPATAGERAVLLFLARLLSLLMVVAGFGIAPFIDDPDRFEGFLFVGGLGVAGLLCLWLARRLDLI